MIESIRNSSTPPPIFRGVYSFMVLVLMLGGQANYASRAGTLVISNQPQQLIRLGIDGTLNYWQPNVSNTLAQFAVQNLQVKYVRVGIPCACELTNGLYNPSAFNVTLGEMAALLAANPNLKFFGSPGTLKNAYTTEQINNLWGGDVPFCCFPPWIQSWTANGTNADGTVNWVFQSINDANLTQYLANFLNFMATNGFTISYLDFKNEDNYLQPSDLAYVSANLNALLNPGVSRPLLVAPSGWSEDNSSSFISTADPSTYEIASTHNTGGAEDPASFVATVQAANPGSPKEIWNSELHNWVGTDMGSEVTNSTYLWDHLIAGFTGIDTWSFFGPYSNVGHTMLLSNGTKVRTNCKYEIFKQLVNNANGGNYLGVGTGSLANAVEAAAFTNNGIQTVWMLNLTAAPLTNVVFQFNGQDLTGQHVAVTRWYASGTPASSPSYDVEKYGQASGFVTTNATFTYTLNGQTLYCFRLVSPPVYPTSPITVHGRTNIYQETGGNWQTLGYNDINNDGHLGSDGFVFFGDFSGNYTSITSPAFGLLTAQLPSYITSFAPGTNYGGITESASYAVIDNPLVTNGTELPASILWGMGGAVGGPQQLLQFTVAGLTAGTIVRVGVLAGVDNSSNGAWDSSSLTLSVGTNSVTVGNASGSPLPSAPISGLPASCGWVFFDCTANGSYSLSATKEAGGSGAGVAGLTFDSYVTPVTTSAVTWRGQVNSNWDTTTANWVDTATASYSFDFANGEAVTFDDSASNSTVNLTGALFPSAVTFSNNLKNYLLAGVGAIGGTNGLTKNGTGSVVLAVSNVFTGPVTVNGGVLELVQPLLATNSTVRVAAGARLQLDFAVTNQVKTLVLNGTSAFAGWHNSATDPTYLAGTGSLWVAMAIPTTSTNLSCNITGNRLTLFWPSNYLGWSLQLQTSSRAAGLGTNWVTVPGSEMITTTNLPVGGTNAAIFYRLMYQP